YHPGVLATIAPYNVVFGKKFDELFHAAAAEIKNFAEALQEQGGSILGNVDGMDVTVDHVAALKETELLKIDYGEALDKFRRVSKLKRALERRPPIRRLTQPIAMPQPAKSSRPAAKPVLVRQTRPAMDVQSMRSAVTPQQIATEETKIRKVEESVRVFVRVADPKFRQIVPMRFFNLTLTPAEADAYCADYVHEKSVRAEFARVLLRSVAVIARITTELEELKRCENSVSLWKQKIQPLLLKRFPDATEEDLRKAHAYAYGGCVLQDMGYYPFGNKYFSDLVHYVRSGDFVAALIRDSSDLNEYAFALGALAHYASDVSGHPIINRITAIEFPSLAKTYGKEDTYANDPK